MQNSRSNANSSKYGIENADSCLPMGLYTSGYGGNYCAPVEKSNKKSKANKSKKSAEADESHKETINIHKQIKEANKLNRVTQKYLEYAAENRPHDIIVDLLSNKKDVIDLINNSLSRDDIVTGINILGKICSSSFTELKTKLISGTNDLFLHNLHDAMNSSSTAHLFNYETVLINILIFLKCSIKIINKNHIDIFGKLLNTCGRYLRNLNKNKDLPKYQIMNGIYEELQKDVHSMSTNWQSGQKSQKVSVYPSAQDLCTNENCIQSNFYVENYQNTDKYISFQINIVREDFLKPLRKSINNLKIKQMQNFLEEKYTSTIYQNVYILEEILLRNKLCTVLDLSSSPEFSRLPTQSTKRFMYGSLIALTTGDYSVVYFATVEDKIDHLKCKLLISFCELYDTSVLYNKNLILLESDVYFEPYHHVLKALIQFDDASFPMADYIIKNKNAIKHPKYSADIISYEYKGNELSIFDLSSWPKSDILGLNDSQLEAIKAALTKELVLIQGPPGTGKTFVGAEIASILLQNLRNQQILVVCYTNQALDNFLKKLIPVTENIVRVGNQSTDPTLAQYHINNRKHGKSNTMMKAMGSIETEIFEILKEIKMYQNLIRTLSSKRGILSMSKNSFATELEDKHWLPVNTNILSPLSSWLLGSSKDRCFIPNYNASIRNIIDVDTVYNKVCYDEKDDLNIFTNLKHLESSLSNLKLDSELEYEVTLENLQTSLHKLNDEIKRKSEQAHNEEYIKEIQNEKQDLEFWLEHLKARMEIGPIQNQKQFSTASATALNFDDRWSLYWHWVDMLQKDYLHKYKECIAEYQSLLNQYEELKYIQYMKFLKDAKVIGMTTTSAARMQIILKELKIPIYIFEEAAEIPEAHVIASLTKHCEHLIMIGDHKQLQPHNASYELSKISNINISLFERLINNGLPYHTLNTQYRMMPKICFLISPIIYENLENGGRTLNYRNIKGFKHNLFFVNHSVPEDHKLDSTSCKNIHEAKFIVKLCHYLKLNQYGSKDITILSTYSGQVQAIENEMKHIDILKKVKVSTVDNFQGQENRIILLSLVRSNKDANIGFLNKQNRICVALSRAMEGLFIIGNMENLSRDTYIWTQIKNVLEEQRAIGSHLPLSIKTKTGTWEFQVQTSEDFDEPISYLLS